MDSPKAAHSEQALAKVAGQEAQASTKELALPPRPKKSADRKRREHEQVERLMTGHLGVKAEDVARIIDDRVVACVKMLSGIVTSQHAFHELMKTLPPEVSQEKLEPVEAVKYDAGAEHTIRSFAEKQWYETEVFATQYLKAFNEVVGLYKLATIKQLNILLSQRDDDDPIPAERLSKILGIDALNKAAEIIGGSNEEWLNASRYFYINVQRTLFKGTTGAAQFDQMQQLEVDREKKEAALLKLADEIAELKGSLASAESKLQGIQKLESGKEEYVKWLNTELERATKDLPIAEKRLRDYTYRCYGVFAHAWERDVSLAQRQVDQLKAEKSELTSKLSQATTDEVTCTKEEKAEVAGQIKALQEKLSTGMPNRKSALENEIQEINDKHGDLKTTLEEMLAKAGAVNLKHLNGIEEATHSFADTNKAAATNTEILNGPIQKQISTIAEVLNEMLTAKTVRKQQRCLQTVVTLCTQKDDQAAVFFRKCRMLQAIGTSDSDGFRWEPETIEDVKISVPSSDPPAIQAAPIQQPAFPSAAPALDIPDSDDDLPPTI